MYNFMHFKLLALGGAKRLDSHLSHFITGRKPWIHSRQDAITGDLSMINVLQFNVNGFLFHFLAVKAICGVSDIYRCCNAMKLF